MQVAGTSKLSTNDPHRLHSVVHKQRFFTSTVFTVQAGGAIVRCPFCRYPDSRVIDSREVEDGQAIRRRRSCPECSRRFTTVEGSLLSVVKRSGVTEPFSRSKVIAGVTRACQGRPVDPDAVAQLAQQVEEAVRGSGQAEVPSQEVGLAILGPLRDLDEVAYLRFASVYRSFTSADDFAAEIAQMRSSRAGADPPTGDPPPVDRPPPVAVG
jgi:transcriptional repressor NrdR